MSGWEWFWGRLAWSIVLFAVVAVGYLLACTASRGDPTDRELVVRWRDGSEMRACAKAAARGEGDPCEAALLGRWHPLGLPPVGEASSARCVPHPGCFDERSNHIPGFN